MSAGGGTTPAELEFSSVRGAPPGGFSGRACYRLAMRPPAAAVLVLFSACGVFSASDDDDDDDDEEARACGFNAQPSGWDCACIEHHDWCDDERVDCCAFDADYYLVTVHEVVVAPYKYLEDEVPWDWDGDIPDWLIDALGLIGYYYPDARTASEVLDLIDEYAPELLEGTVPPDPYFEVYDRDGDAQHASGVFDDTYEAPFGESFRVSPQRDDDAILYFWDEDIAFDDEVQGFYLTPDGLAWASGRGEIAETHLGNVFWLNVEVLAHYD